jgi:hypothetical protein
MLIGPLSGLRGTASGRIAAGLAASVLIAASVGALARAAFPAAREPSPEVLQAIRLLLSSDPREEARGERALKRMGAAIVPELRYWVRKARNEADRVEIVLSDIEGAPEGKASSERMSASEFFHRKLVECRDLYRNGQVRLAASTAEAVVLLDPESPYAWELRRLVRRARERLVAEEVLEPLIEVEKLVYEAGETAEITFRITNHEARPARIRLDKGVLGTMDTLVTRQFLDGSARREELKLRIQVPQEVDQILIGPGRSWEQRVEFAAAAEWPRQGMVARVQVAGRFRPTRWTVEAKDENLSLSMPGVEFWVVPAGESAQCDRPLEKLTAALFFEKLEPFFVGGQLSVWAGEDDPYFNEKAIETLIMNMKDLDPKRLGLANQFLNQATGQHFPADPARWEAWWNKVTGAAPRGDPPAGDQKPFSTRDAGR